MHRIIEIDNKAQNARFHGVVITLHSLGQHCNSRVYNTHTHMHAFVFITETDCNLIKDSNTLQIEDDKCAVTITNKISTELSNMMKNNFAT